MAIELFGKSAGRALGFEMSTAVTAGTSLTDLCEIRLYGRAKQASIEVENTGATNALTEFAILFKQHKGGQWSTLLSGDDFGSTNDVLKVVTTNPKTLAAGAEAGLVLACLEGFYSLKMQAKRTSTTTVKVRGTVT